MLDGSGLDGSGLDGSGRVRSGSSVLTWPNAITAARLCAVPVAVRLVLRGRLDAAFVLFLLAGLSDAVDGWLARRGAASALGAVLDPVADKALLVGMVLALAATGLMPGWLAALVILRDLVVVGGVLVLWLRGRAVAIRPLSLGKANTALQIVLVSAVLLESGYGVRLGWLLPALGWGVAAIGLASVAAYGRLAARDAARPS